MGSKEARRARICPRADLYVCSVMSDSLQPHGWPRTAALAKAPVLWGNVTEE